MHAAKAETSIVEECWLLVGQRRGRIWYGRRMNWSRGHRSSVRFDGLLALEREEQKGDVLGFLHTHPDGPSIPSQRDVRTMRAWCSALGKDLLCAIISPEGLIAYRFDDESNGSRLKLLQTFPRGVVIGVD